MIFKVCFVLQCHQLSLLVVFVFVQWLSCTWKPWPFPSNVIPEWLISVWCGYMWPFPYEQVDILCMQGWINTCIQMSFPFGTSISYFASGFLSYPVTWDVLENPRKLARFLYDSFIWCNITHLASTTSLTSLLTPPPFKYWVIDGP